jgi:DNA-binding MarR family transcriptional regulator
MQIRERMLDKMSDTSRIVERLIVKKLVRKRMNKKDKRLVDVQMSAKGNRLMQKLDQSAAAIDRVLNNISEADATELNRLLDKVRGSV